MSPNRFAQLREHLLRVPSPYHWEELLWLFEHWPDDAERAAALDYAREHMRHWPPETRTFFGMYQSHLCWPLASGVAIQAESVDFSRLIGEDHIISLTLASNSHLTDLQELAPLTQIKQLSIQSCHQLNTLDGIDALQSLVHLYIGSCRQLTDLSALNGLPHIHTVELFDLTQLRSLPSLHALTQLKALLCTACASLTTLGDLSSLKGLKLLNISGSEQLRDLEALSALPSLEHLYARSCNALERVDGLGSLAQLKDLFLEGCYRIALATPEERKALTETMSGLASLEHLNVSSTSIDSLSYFAGIPRLQRLNAEECDALCDFEGLGTQLHLKQLHTPFCSQLTRLSQTPLDLPQLEWLNLDGCDHLESTQGMQSLHNLQRLQLRSCHSLRELDHLQTLTQLRDLNLEDCPSLQSLEGLPTSSLTKLALGAFGPSVSLAVLQGARQLTRLRLSSVHHWSDLNALKTLSLPSLEALYITDCAALTSLDGIEHLTHLKKLSIASCEKLQDVSALVPLEQLEELSFSACHQVMPVPLRQKMDQPQDLQQFMQALKRAITTQRESPKRP